MLVVYCLMKIKYKFDLIKFINILQPFWFILQDVPKNNKKKKTQKKQNKKKKTEPINVFYR